jgi:hypothetical protein
MSIPERFGRVRDLRKGQEEQLEKQNLETQKVGRRWAITPGSQRMCGLHLGRQGWC